VRSRLLLIVLVWVIASGILPGGARAQDGTPARLDVFLAQDPATGTAHLYFVDALSGLSTVVTVDSGRNFTLVGAYVLYEKPINGAIMRATANGTIEPHPFIHRTPDYRAIRWVTSPDAQAIAWVQITTSGYSEAYTAWADGRDLRQLPIALPDTTVELTPVALARGVTDFFYNIAPPADLTAAPVFARYPYLARYSITDEAFYPLPGEPECACGAAFTPDGRIFARLEASTGEGPFDLHVWDLRSDASTLVPAANLPFRLAGDLLLNDSGTLAVYSVAMNESAAEGDQQYALVLVDVVARQQYLVIAPGAVRYHPLAFIDDDGALLLAGINDPGTYKLSLVSGELQRVSNQRYLGTITAGS
jgi:hypothetical protein